MKVAYITSSSYSGSTLFSFVLNSHPDIGTISEFDVIDIVRSKDDYKCSCGANYLECGFFTELEKRMRADGTDFSLHNMDLMFNITSNEKWNRYLMQKLPMFHSTGLEDFRNAVLNCFPAYRSFFSKQHHKNRLFMRHVVDLQHASVFLDANKNPYRMKVLNRKHDVYPVYIYKNGISGAFSLYWNERKSKKALDFKRSCTKWFVEQITILRALKEFPAERVNLLDYSTLCAETQASVNQIYRALGLADHGVEAFTEAEHHIIGNSMRVKGIGEIKEATRWKEVLQPAEYDIYRKVYDKYCPMIRKYSAEVADNLWYPKANS